MNTGIETYIGDQAGIRGITAGPTPEHEAFAGHIITQMGAAAQQGFVGKLAQSKSNGGPRL